MPFTFLQAGFWLTSPSCQAHWEWRFPLWWHVLALDPTSEISTKSRKRWRCSVSQRWKPALVGLQPLLGRQTILDQRTNVWCTCLPSEHVSKSLNCLKNADSWVVFLKTAFSCLFYYFTTSLWTFSCLSIGEKDCTTDQRESTVSCCLSQNVITVVGQFVQIWSIHTQTILMMQKTEFWLLSLKYITWNYVFFPRI